MVMQWSQSGAGLLLPLNLLVPKRFHIANAKKRLSIYRHHQTILTFMLKIILRVCNGFVVLGEMTSFTATGKTATLLHQEAMTFTLVGGEATG